MKLNKFAIIIAAFAVVTAVAGTTAASLQSPTLRSADVHVRRDELVDPTVTVPLIYVGNSSIIPAPGFDLTVNVNDTRTPGSDTRKGRTSSDLIIQTANATTINSGVIILP